MMKLIPIEPVLSRRPDGDTKIPEPVLEGNLKDEGFNQGYCNFTYHSPDN